MSQASADSETPARLLETAREAAHAAAEVHREAAGREGGRWVESKMAASDFVCDVDLAAQEAALSVVAARHPAHEIVAEERDGERSGGPGVLLVTEAGGRVGRIEGGPVRPVRGSILAANSGSSLVALRSMLSLS